MNLTSKQKIIHNNYYLQKNVLHELHLKKQECIIPKIQQQQQIFTNKVTTKQRIVPKNKHQKKLKLIVAINGSLTKQPIKDSISFITI